MCIIYVSAIVKNYVLKPNLHAQAIGGNESISLLDVHAVSSWQASINQLPGSTPSTVQQPFSKAQTLWFHGYFAHQNANAQKADALAPTEVSEPESA